MSLQLRTLSYSNHLSYFYKKILMGTGGYKITDLGAMYFVSFAVVGWINVFTRKDYRDVVIENI